MVLTALLECIVQQIQIQLIEQAAFQYDGSFKLRYHDN